MLLDKKGEGDVVMIIDVPSDFVAENYCLN
jgi:hypothetical protein